MTPTNTQRTRLRRKLNLDAAALPDAEIDDLFAEAAETYADYATEPHIMFQAAYYFTVVELINQATNEVDYDQNEESEKASQRRVGLERLANRLKADLVAMMAEADRDDDATPVRMGRMKKVPSRREGYPDATA